MLRPAVRRPARSLHAALAAARRRPCIGCRATRSAFAHAAAATGIAELLTAYRAPRRNSTCERLLGSVPRECTDQMLVLGEAHLRRILREYVAYFTGARPRLGLRQRVPAAQETSPCAEGRAAPCTSGASIRPVAILGGLHHAYERAA